VARYQAILRLLKEFGRKHVKTVAHRARLETDAISGFLSRNAQAFEKSLQWDASSKHKTRRLVAGQIHESDTGLPVWIPEDMVNLLLNARGYLSAWLRQVDDICEDPIAVLQFGVFGPGKTSGCKSNDLLTKMTLLEPTSPSEKASSYWSEFLKRVVYRSYPRDGDTHMDSREFSLPVAPVIGCAGLSTVEKNAEELRVILKGTTIGSWFTLGIGNLFEQALVEHVDIDIKVQQEINRMMAIVGSLMDPRFYQYATIDLKKSSDFYYWSLVDWFMCGLPNIKALMHESLESEFEYMDNTDASEPVLRSENLHIAGTMGTGWTFPFQTIFYAALCQAILDEDHERMNNYESNCSCERLAHRGNLPEYSVFGDDIIIHEVLAERLMAVLHGIRAEVNLDKSFVTGPFKESCGVDAYAGWNIRPVYIRHLRDYTDVVDLLNRVTFWCTNWDVSLQRVVTLLLDALPQDRRNAVPIWELTTAGVRVPEVLMPSWRSSLEDLNACKRMISAAYSTGGVMYTPFRAVPHVLEVPKGNQQWAQSRVEWTTYDDDPFASKRKGCDYVIVSPAYAAVLMQTTLGRYTLGRRYVARDPEKVQGDLVPYEARETSWALSWVHPPVDIEINEAGPSRARVYPAVTRLGALSSAKLTCQDIPFWSNLSTWQEYDSALLKLYRSLPGGLRRVSRGLVL